MADWQSRVLTKVYAKMRHSKIRSFQTHVLDNATFAPSLKNT